MAGFSNNGRGQSASLAPPSGVRVRVRARARARERRHFRQVHPLDNSTWLGSIDSGTHATHTYRHTHTKDTPRHMVISVALKWSAVTSR